jgi:hypothetical protein
MRKHYNVVDAVLPPWTEGEVRAVRNRIVREPPALLERYASYGGVARYLFATKSDYYLLYCKSGVHDQLAGRTADFYLRATTTELSKREGEWAQKLLHLWSSPDGWSVAGVVIRPASDAVAALMVQRLHECLQLSAQSFAATVLSAADRTCGVLGVLIGHAFERFSHRLLAAGHEATLHRVAVHHNSDSTASSASASTASTATTATQSFAVHRGPTHSLSSHAERRSRYSPQRHLLPAGESHLSSAGRALYYDSTARVAYLLQMIVSRGGHRFPCEKLVRAAQHCQRAWPDCCAVRLVFVVPFGGGHAERRVSQLPGGGR